MKKLDLPRSIRPSVVDLWTGINFTCPRKDCLYIQILKALSTHKELSTKKLLEYIKGGDAHLFMTNGYYHDHSVFSSLRGAGYISREKGGWAITQRGEAYLIFTGL